MAIFHRVLIAVDGSEASLDALRAGCQLARAERAGITAVCVGPRYEGDLSLVGVGDLQATMHEPCTEAFEHADGIAREQGVSLTVIEEVGEPHDKIVEVARQRHCDLVVVGLPKAGALKRLLLGSVAIKVAGSAPGDVLVVPRGTRFGWEKVLAVADSTPLGTAVALKALEFARCYGARLVVATLACQSGEPVGMPGEAVRCSGEISAQGWEAIDRQALSAGVQTQRIALQGRADKAIGDFAGELQIQLIVLGLDAASLSAKFFGGNRFASILRSAACPVLVVKG
jgi:nucleotide-binding universal stress UspA family protein